MGLGRATGLAPGRATAFGAGLAAVREAGLAPRRGGAAAGLRAGAAPAGALEDFFAVAFARFTAICLPYLFRKFLI
jgi:hypothetical protein